MGMFSCKKCKKCFVSKDFLKLHERKGCGRPRVYQECSICKKKFESKKHLNAHYGRHAKETKRKNEQKHKPEKSASKSPATRSKSKSTGGEITEGQGQEAVGKRGKEEARDAVSVVRSPESQRQYNESTAELHYEEGGQTFTEPRTLIQDCNVQEKKLCHETDDAEKETLYEISFDESDLDSTNPTATPKIVVIKRLPEEKRRYVEDKFGNLANQNLSIVHQLPDSASEVNGTEKEGTTVKTTSKRRKARIIKDYTAPEVVRPYSCEICNMKFVSTFFLEDHMRTHANQKSFICLVCEERFNRQVELTKHRRTHPGVKPYACHICRREFNDNSGFRRHVNTHSEVRSFMCEICGQGFKCKSTLQSHKLTHSDAQPHKCTQCDKRYKHPGALRQHVMLVHEKTTWFECDSCDQKFTLKVQLVEHLKRHAGVNSHFCDECEAAFVSGSSLTKHIRKHHKDTRYECPVCNKSCGRQYDLKIHMRTHSGYRPFACKVCRMTFITKHNLVRHELLHDVKDSLSKAKDTELDGKDGDETNADNDDGGVNNTKERLLQPYTCEECGNMYVFKNNLEKHMKETHSVDPVECEVCGLECLGAVMLKEHVKNTHVIACNHCKMKFVDRESLHNHLESAHPGVAEGYKCEFCSAEFRYRSELVLHRGKHPETKQHTCERCNISFSRLRSLHVHMLSHADVVPHCCPFCDMKFYLEEQLDTHLKKHNQNRTVKCPICPRRFKNTTVMFRHQKVHQNITKPYRCKICQIGFSGDIYLHRHMRRFHENPVRTVNHPEISLPSTEETEASQTENPEQNTVMLHMPESNELQTASSDEIQYITQLADATEAGDGVVTYIVLENGEVQQLIPSEGQELLVNSVGDAPQLVANESDEPGLSTNSDVQHVTVSSDLPNWGEGQVGEVSEILVETADNGTVENVESSGEIITETVNLVHQDHSYLSPGPQILYVNPTDVVLGSEVDMVMEVYDSAKGEGETESGSGVVENESVVIESERESVVFKNGSESQGEGVVLINSGYVSAEPLENRNELSMAETSEMEPVLQIETVTNDTINVHSQQSEHFEQPCYQKVHKCRICGLEYNSKRALTFHFKRTHPDHSLLHCTICNKDFRSKTNYREHQYIHRGTKREMCHICGGAFLSKNRLLKHLKTHQNDRSYSCDVCGKSFKQSAGLRKHKVTHGDKKDFECEVCLKRFFHKSLLKEHLQRHYGIKRYSCDLCDKSFVTSSNLNVHKRSHHSGRKPRGRPPVKRDPTKKQFSGRKVTIQSGDEEGTSEGVVTFQNVQLVIGEEVVTEEPFGSVSVKPFYQVEG